MNKRGLSMVVTTLIIILLVLVAIGIVWVVVRNIIQSGTESAELSAKCFNIDIKATAVSCNGGTCDVTLTRTGSNNDEIAGIKLLFFNATDDTSSVIDVSGNIAPLATVTKSVDGEIINANKVEVTAYFKDTSGDEKHCSTTSFNIGAGDEGSGGNGNGEECGNGSLEGTEGCDDGNTISGDGCSSTCIIEGGWECTGEPSICTEIGGSCLTSDNCTDFGYECGDWDNLCEGTFNCGDCSILYGSGYECNATGRCEIETSVNSGTVDSVWPPLLGAAMYFDSEDLPKSGVDYFGYYINFTGAETGCLLIAGYIIPDYPEIYNKSHIRFSFPSDIAMGDIYEIWESETCGA